MEEIYYACADQAIYKIQFEGVGRVNQQNFESQRSERWIIEKYSGQIY
jgi:hypothetical protein